MYPRRALTYSSKIPLDTFDPNSTMKGRLCSFLDSCFLAEGGYTHTTKPCPDPENTWKSGVYSIVDPEVKKVFWDIYCKSVEHGVVSTIAEKPGPVFPLHADFDMKYSTDFGTDKRLLSTSALHKIVHAYQNAIRSVVDPDVYNDRIVRCIVLQKSRPRPEEGFIKDGFHLHFPFFICDAWTQDQYVYRKVLEELEPLDVFSKKRTGLDIKKVMDSGMARKVWLLYGAMNWKSSHSRPYLYNRWADVPLQKQYGHVYDENLNEITMDVLFEEEMVGRPNPVRYYLPELLSIQGYTQETPLMDTYVKQRQKYNHQSQKTRKFNIVHKRKREDILSDLKMIEDGGLLEMLSIDRANNHDTKMEVGWCLFCITEGGEEGLALWKRFCRRADDYDENKCDNRWNNMKIKNMTMGTLRHWARIDSPDQYNMWRSYDVRNQMMDIIRQSKITEGAMARVAIALYRDRFLCSNIKGNEWYCYVGHRWIQNDAAKDVWNILNEDLRIEFIKFRSEMYKELVRLKEAYDTMDPTLKKEPEGIRYKQEIIMHETYIKGCDKAVDYLDTAPCLKRTVDMMAIKLNDPKFEETKDRNAYLVGFENGVLDMQQRRFRNGTPDDKITMTTGYDYCDHKTNPDATRFFVKFFSRLFPNPNIRDYALRTTASVLIGGNIHKQFRILTGYKDSGKSTFIKLIKYALGKGEYGYYGTFPPQSFTNSTNQSTAGGPSPQEIRLLDKRVGIANEVAGRLNAAFIKLWSGGDDSYRRGMYDRKGGDKEPLITIYVQCNDIPEIPSDEDAALDRVKVIDFQSKFVLPADLERYPVPDTEDQRIALKRWKAKPIDHKIIMYAPYFVSYLLDIYIETDGKLTEPKEVIVSTDTYREDNDVYLHFIKDNLERVSEDNGPKSYKHSAKKLFNEYQMWYKQYYRTTAIQIDLKKFIREMKKDKRLGLIRAKEDHYGYDPNKKTFYGYSLKVDDEDQEIGLVTLK